MAVEVISIAHFNITIRNIKCMNEIEMNYNIECERAEYYARDTYSRVLQ